MASNSPIFLIGRFRAGTTLRWNFFREFPQFDCIYEPLHEALLTHLDHGEHRPSDATHHQKKDYWIELRNRDRKRLGELWQTWFANSRFWLDAGEPAPELQAYLQFLLETAPPGLTTVFKFVRADFRAAWLKHNFPTARIIHLTRTPRDLWASTLGRDTNVDDSVRDDEVHFNMFRYYLFHIAQNMRVDFDGHPYRLFYLIWRLSYAAVDQVADATWSYEDTMANFPVWAKTNLVDTGLLPAIPDLKIEWKPAPPMFHPVEWYAEQEAIVDRFLAAAPTEDLPENVHMQALYRTFTAKR